MTIPILYKYLDPAGAKALLSNLTFKFSPPNQLNDPFEFMPGGYTGDTPEERLRRQMELIYSEKYRLHWNQKTGMSIPSEDWKDFVNDFPDNEKEILANAVFDAAQERNWKPFVDRISTSFGLTCFSCKVDSMLMWSHYAKSHQGIAIGFNLKNYSKKLHKVKYVEQRIKIPLSSTCNDEEEKKAIMLSVMTSKSTDWRYEEEWRLIDHLPPEQDGLYLFKFDPRIILSIYWGTNITEDDKNEIMLMIKNLPNYRDIKIFHMSPVKDKFALEPRPQMFI